MSNSDNITCYGHQGTSYTDLTKCPDSDSCCQTVEQCRPDRLCFTDDSNEALLRAPCITQPWSSQVCATICLFDYVDGSLPRVTVCSDGSYCCDDEPTCCADKTGFWLNEDGELIGRANESNPRATSGLSKQGEVGVGVGVGVGGAAVIGLLLFWFLWRRRKNNNAANNNIVPVQQYQNYYPTPTQTPFAQSSRGGYGPVQTASSSQGTPFISELEGAEVVGEQRDIKVERNPAELPS